MRTFLLLCILFASARPGFGADEVTLQFAPGKLEDVLALYGKLIGKTIVSSNTVQGQIILSASKAMPPGQAASLIEKSLFVYGFSLVDSGPDAVLVFGLGQPVRNQGVPVYSSAEEFPKAERIFSYVYKAQHRGAQELAATLTQYIPPTNLTAFNPDPTSGTLLVTGPTSIVRNVVRLLAVLDVAAEPKSGEG